MTPEHRLLVSLGGSDGAVLALIDQLHAQQPAITQLHVVTTQAADIVDNLHSGLLAQLSDDELLRTIPVRVWVVGGVDDIRTDQDHVLMAEILYRLVLDGTDWRDAVPDRRFSVGLAGGRKTMSASLQQAATFLGADAVFHVVYEGPPNNAPRTLSAVRQQRDRHHLICLVPQRLAWRELLAGPWRHRYADLPLQTSRFPIAGEGWDGSAATEPVSVAYQEDPRCPLLSAALNDIATLASIFASPESLAAGMGGQFLRHDLRGLLRRLDDRPELVAIRAYIERLQQLTHISRSLQAERFSWRQLPALCEQALMLAIGRAVQGLDAPGLLTVQCEGCEALNGLAATGVNHDLLLLILRNLFANICNHGKSAALPTPLAILRIQRAGDRVELEVRNRLPEEEKEALSPIVSAANGALPSLLDPCVSRGRHGGDGLGLFTVQQVAQRTAGAVILECPRLDPWPGVDFDFVVRLTFTHNVPEPA